jgi:hypothetical protein
VQIRTIPELEPELEQVINVFNPWLAIEVNTTRYGGNHNRHRARHRVQGAVNHAETVCSGCAPFDKLTTSG